MRKQIFLAIIATPIFYGCSTRPIITDHASFYGDEISEVATYFERKGHKCKKGNYSYPINVNRMDLLCTYLEKTWICPRQYKIVIPYDVQNKLVTGPAYIDHRKLCF